MIVITGFGTDGALHSTCRRDGEVKRERLEWQFNAILPPSLHSADSGTTCLRDKLQIFSISILRFVFASGRLWIFFEWKVEKRTFGKSEFCRTLHHSSVLSSQTQIKLSVKAQSAATSWHLYSWVTFSHEKYIEDWNATPLIYHKQQLKCSLKSKIRRTLRPKNTFSFKIPFGLKCNAMKN